MDEKVDRCMMDGEKMMIVAQRCFIECFVF